MPLSYTSYDDVPYWEHSYIYSKDDLDSADYSQQKFYAEFKSAFMADIYYDLLGNFNYCFILLFDLYNEYINTTIDLEQVRHRLQILAEAYPVTASYANSKIIEVLIASKSYAEAWDIQKKSGFWIDEIVTYERLLKKSLLDSVVIKKLAGIKGLTSYGKRHIDAILVLAEKNVRKIEKTSKKRLLPQFIKRVKWEKYNLLEYKQYYTDKKEYAYYSAIDYDQADFRRGTMNTPHTVVYALQAHLQTLIRDAENEYRELNGVPKIGEGWVGETELYYYIKELLPECKVLHNARLDWLKPQHLDVYIEDYNIAIEYQGEQHYKPVGHFGGEKSFKLNQKRDAVKFEKCLNNNCTLIYINKTHSQDFVKETLFEKIRQTV